MTDGKPMTGPWKGGGGVEEQVWWSSHSGVMPARLSTLTLFYKGLGGQWSPLPTLFTLAAAATHPPPPLKKTHLG